MSMLFPMKCHILMSKSLRWKRLKNKIKLYKIGLLGKSLFRFKLILDKYHGISKRYNLFDSESVHFNEGLCFFNKFTRHLFFAHDHCLFYQRERSMRMSGAAMDGSTTRLRCEFQEYNFCVKWAESIMQGVFSVHKAECRHAGNNRSPLPYPVGRWH